MLIAVLRVTRLIARFALAHPADANESNQFLRFVADTVHFLLYVGIIGTELSTMANLPALLRGDVPFPGDF